MRFTHGDEEIKACEFCEKASALHGETDMLCSVRGVVSRDFFCRRFSYDLLKRVPKAPLKPIIPDPYDMTL